MGDQERRKRRMSRKERWKVVSGEERDLICPTTAKTVSPESGPASVCDGVWRSEVEFEVELNRKVNDEVKSS